MCFSACERPVKIYNKYLGEKMFVPCGECDVCRANKASIWTQRLEVERSAHKYCLFVTLTYSDDFLPVLREDGDILVDSFAGLYMSKLDLDYDLYYSKYYRAFNGIPYLCFQDAQKFIKRLRQRVLRNDSTERKEDRYVRYYCCGEYGETTFRPHFHLLIFTNSDWLANNGKSVISSCWSTDNRSSDKSQLGRIDCQVVKYTASGYVAAYLNSNVNLPRFLRESALRPRAIFSKFPAIGSLLTSTKEVQELFNSGSVTMPCVDPRTCESVEHPISSELRNRLYPKLPFFSRFSDSCLSSVYASAVDIKGMSFRDFEQYVRRRYESSFGESSRYFSRLIDDSSSWIYPQVNTSACLRLFTVLRRVAFQSDSFGISPLTYGKRIIQFYKDFDYYKLTHQLEHEVDLSLANGPHSCLLVDKIFIDDIKKNGLSPSQLNILRSYGYDETELSLSDFLELLDGVYDEQFVDKVSKARRLVHDFRQKRAKYEYLTISRSRLTDEQRQVLTEILNLYGFFSNYECVAQSDAQPKQAPL